MELTTKTLALRRTKQALKRQDGEALYRRDVQYQFLQELFDDERFSFINPDGSDTRLHFSQLYLDCLSNSSKVTRNLRDRLVENKEFAMNYAKLSLLINVGRINTTLACESAPVFYFASRLSY